MLNLIITIVILYILIKAIKGSKRDTYFESPKAKAEKYRIANEYWNKYRNNF